MKLIISFLLMACLSFPAWAEQDTSSELQQIRHERLKLMQVREKLESKLGHLGKELRKFDVALVEARSVSRNVGLKLKAANKQLKVLRIRKTNLEIRIKQLRKLMQAESIVAYQRAKREMGWLDVMLGVSVTEVPHRKYMLHALLKQQDEDRKEWQQLMIELAKVEDQEKLRRDELVHLHAKKKSAEKNARARVAEKRKMVRKVRHNSELKKKRIAQLDEQEQALLKLLKGLKESLLAEDKAPHPLNIRKQKGKLSWPLKGVISARFGSRPTVGRPKLVGVQMKPKSLSGKGRQVKTIAAGQVRYADWFGGYGLMLVIDHGDGLMTVYAHNDALYWQLGDWVEAGEVLADVGSTGWTESVRLYFEVRDKGKAVNPKRWCRR
ncbi:MAG: peptidoglycan DD-metalloendopeptidase family protein [Mariprofundaceae bacterium]